MNDHVTVLAALIKFNAFIREAFSMSDGVVVHEWFLDPQAVLWIRNVYTGSEFFPSRIQGQKDSWIRIKEFKYFSSKKCF
jgi:hypothetical protein